MARSASGQQHINAAKALPKNVKNAGETCLAQSVLLPLELDLSLQQTVVCLSRSVGTTCTMRTRFAQVAEGKPQPASSKRSLHSRAHFDLAQQAKALDTVMAPSNESGIIILRIRAKLQLELDKPLARFGRISD